MAFAPPGAESSTDALPRPAGAVRAWLFNADGRDQQVDPYALRLPDLSQRQLAWIDASVAGPEAARQLLQRLGLEILPAAALTSEDQLPLHPWQDWFIARAEAAAIDVDPPRGEPWWLVVGPNAVLTLHRAPLPFLDELFDRDDPDSQLGVLSADSFAASLLDRMLTAYFAAIDSLEDEVDEFEVALLVPRLQGSKLPALRKLRRTVSTLRRMLASHRDLFDALSRPDFRPDRQDEANGHFVAVSARYERAVDAVENARSLLIGAFELLSARQSQQTNDSMRVLTFVTVLLGSLAVIAGVLGMNFDAGLFHTGSRGLWTAIGGMALIVIAATLWARARGWWH
jgi:Mg2+ and Co2+ transporter CorA